MCILYVFTPKNRKRYKVISNSKHATHSSYINTGYSCDILHNLSWNTEKNVNTAHDVPYEIVKNQMV